MLYVHNLIFLEHNRSLIFLFIQTFFQTCSCLFTLTIMYTHTHTHTHTHTGCLYIGASAGAIVAGKSIETALWKGWDDPAVAGDDFEWYVLFVSTCTLWCNVMSSHIMWCAAAAAAAMKWTHIAPSTCTVRTQRLRIFLLCIELTWICLDSLFDDSLSKTS